MEPFDVIKYVSSRLVLSAITPMVNSLPFEHPEESLAGSIVATMTDCAHTAYQAVTAEITLVVATGELTASI